MVQRRQRERSLFEVLLPDGHVQHKGRPPAPHRAKPARTATSPTRQQWVATEFQRRRALTGGLFGRPSALPHSEEETAYCAGGRLPHRLTAERGDEPSCRSRLVGVCRPIATLT
jgi:hypothetical protein